MSSHDEFHAAHRWEHHDERLPVDPDLDLDDPGNPSPLHHPVPHVHRGRRHRVVAAIALGGFIGALARYELELAWRTPAGHLPWTTFTINTSGAFLLGLLLTLLSVRPSHTRYLRPFLCVGVLGAWTTMSTFAVDADLLVKGGHLALAYGYVTGTVIAGVTVTWAGVRAGRVLAARMGTRWAWR
jgi:fluoride exporter